MRDKLRRFWNAPFFDKLYLLSNLCYKIKGMLLYRVVFKEFGKGSYIRKPLLILGPECMTIGARVSIRDGARIEVIRSKEHPSPDLLIGSDTTIEQNVHIICRNRVHIGSNVSITGNCSIVDVTHPYEDIHDPTKIGERIEAAEDTFVEVGDGSFIGFGCVILPKVKIGKYVIIGANSVVTRSVPDYSVVAGSPAVVLKHFDFDQQAWVKSPSAMGIRSS